MFLRNPDKVFQFDLYKILHTGWSGGVKDVPILQGILIVIMLPRNKRSCEEEKIEIKYVM